tara:strand:- start:685 stop:1125 length:441 start_codon:yes stop_codon:yes gene_type:complete
MIDQLRTLLEQDEGIEHSIYRDHLGKLTTGIGHLVTESDAEFGQPVGTNVSADRVTELFNEDVKTCISDCRHLIFDFNGMPVSAQITASSLAFQLGVNRYGKFKKHLSAMDAGDWMEAAAQLRDSKLYRQTPERTERHAKRLESIV